MLPPDHAVCFSESVPPHEPALRALLSRRFSSLLDLRTSHPAEKLVTAPAGSVVVTNAPVWHGGFANRTDSHRTALHAFYRRRDKPQQQYQKPLLRPEVQASLSPDLRHLPALDDPLNAELAKSDVARSRFLP
jgi:ectoine hydroxylase-related dioxygenase (phytanoyl-CoA dioxygenase family)